MGFFKIDRDLLHHELWLEGSFSPGQAWIDLIGLAAWKDHKAKLTRDVKRGELWTNLRYLAERWRWSKQRVSDFLDRLSSQQMILQNRDTKRGSGGTLITIVNYSLYQDFTEDEQSEKGHKTDTKKDTERPQKGHKKSYQKKGKKGKEENPANFWRVVVDVRRALQLPDLIPEPKTLGIAKRLYKAVGEDDTRFASMLQNFYIDKDPWLIRKNHALQYCEPNIHGIQRETDFRPEGLKDTERDMVFNGTE